MTKRGVHSRRRRPFWAIACLSLAWTSAGAGTLAAEGVAGYAGYYPYRMLARDLDGDGRRDLVVLDRSGFKQGVRGHPVQFGVLLNDGSGRFPSAQSHALQTYAKATSVTSGDYDGDGVLDVAVSSAYLSDITGTYDASVEVFFGDGAGGFRAVTTRHVSPTQPTYDVQSVVSGDWDGDGIDDLAAFASAGGNGLLTVLMSNGDGTFAFSETTLAAQHGRLAVLDWDRDGDRDLFLARGNSDRATVFLNDGSGGFTSTPFVLTALQAGRTLSWVGDVSVVDLDADGAVDVVFDTYDYSLAANLLSARTGILWGAAGGGVSAQTEIAGGGEQQAFMDVDGDGRLDIVASRYPVQYPVVSGGGTGFDGVSYFLNLGNRTFAAGHRLPSGGNGSALAAADFDGDGRVGELALANYSESGGLTVIASVGTGGLGYLRTLSLVGMVHQSYADMDNDGVLDSIAIAGTGVRIDGGDGVGGFDDPAAYHGAWGAGVVEVVALDIDQDGYKDLFGRADRGPVLAALNPLGAATGASWDANPVSLSGIGGATGLAVGDITGDGAEDVVVATNGGVYAYDAVASGGLSSPRSLGASATDSRGIRLADIDGDGDLDLLTRVYDGANYQYVLTWSANDGTGRFAGGVELLRSQAYGYLGDVQVADVDEDGRLDVLVAARTAQLVDELHVLVGGATGFVDRLAAAFADGYGFEQMAVGDLDGDGHVDVAIGQRGTRDQANRPNGVMVRYGDGAGGFPRREYYAVEYPVVPSPSLVTVGRLLGLVDLDGDGSVELSLSNGHGTTVLARPGTLGADRTPPVVTPPADVRVAAVDANGTPASDPLIAAFLGGASATDDRGVVGGIVDDAPAVFPLGATLVTFSATDAAGNRGTAMGVVRVVDVTPPVVTPPADLIVEATGPRTPVDPGSARVSDNVDSGLSALPDRSGPFGLGVHTIVWTATDGAGNTASADQTVTVLDRTPPIVTLLGDDPVILAVGDGFSDPGARATDRVDGDVAVSVGGRVDTAVAGEYTLVYSARDGSGNIGQASRRVRIVAATAGGDEASGAARGADHGLGAMFPGALFLPFIVAARALRRR